MSNRDKACFCIVGGDSAIGAAFAKSLRANGLKAISSTRRGVIDPSTQFALNLLADPTELWIPDCDVLVLAAAMTRLAECRSDVEMTQRVNVDAQIALAELALKRGAFVIFLSTNQVFDGTKLCFAPNEPMTPKSVYGSSKARAETELQRLGQGVAIVRLSKVIGPHLTLFQGWRESLLKAKPVNAYSDLVMAPISLTKVLQGLSKIGLDHAHGIWHLSGRQDISYVEAGRHLAWRLGADETLIISASAAAAGIPEDERPAHASLASDETAVLTGIRIGDARTELDIGLDLLAR